MLPIFSLSPRPGLTVDNLGRRFVDPNGASVGVPGPFGRDRITAALPTNGDGPVQVEHALTLAAPGPSYIVDPSGNLLGENNALWIERMLDARWCEDTRRLGG